MVTGNTHLHPCAQKAPSQNLLCFQVGKLIFLLLAMSFMAASWLLKYQLLLDWVQRPLESRKTPNPHLIGSEENGTVQD